MQHGQRAARLSSDFLDVVGESQHVPVFAKRNQFSATNQAPVPTVRGDRATGVALGRTPSVSVLSANQYSFFEGPQFVKDVFEPPDDVNAPSPAIPAIFANAQIRRDDER